MASEPHIADSGSRHRAPALASVICGLAGNALFFEFDNILGLALAAVGMGLAIWAFVRGYRVLAASGLLVSAPPVALCVVFALWALFGTIPSDG
jgi:hypothetical protein